MSQIISCTHAKAPEVEENQDVDGVKDEEDEEAKALKEAGKVKDEVRAAGTKEESEGKEAGNVGNEGEDDDEAAGSRDESEAKAVGKDGAEVKFVAPKDEDDAKFVDAKFVPFATSSASMCKAGASALGPPAVLCHELSARRHLQHRWLCCVIAASCLDFFSSLTSQQQKQPPEKNQSNSWQIGDLRARLPNPQSVDPAGHHQGLVSHRVFFCPLRKKLIIKIINGELEIFGPGSQIPNSSTHRATKREW